MEKRYGDPLHNTTYLVCPMADDVSNLVLLSYRKKNGNKTQRPDTKHHRPMGRCAEREKDKERVERDFIGYQRTTKNLAVGFAGRSNCSSRKKHANKKTRNKREG